MYEFGNCDTNYFMPAGGGVLVAGDGATAGGAWASGLGGGTGRRRSFEIKGQIVHAQIGVESDLVLRLVKNFQRRGVALSGSRFT